MTNKEALETVEKMCDNCFRGNGKCAEAEREKCWVQNAKVALFYSVPKKPIAKGYRRTSRGLSERLYCSHCQKPIRNDNKLRFCPRCGKAIDWEV